MGYRNLKVERYYVVYELGADMYSAVLFFEGGDVCHTLELGASFKSYRDLQAYIHKDFNFLISDFDNLLCERFLASTAVKKIYFSEDWLKLRPEDFFSDFYLLQKLYKSYYFKKTLTPDFLEKLTGTFCRAYSIEFSDMVEMLNDSMDTLSFYDLMCQRGLYTRFSMEEEID